VISNVFGHGAPRHRHGGDDGKRRRGGWSDWRSCAGHTGKRRPMSRSRLALPLREFAGKMAGETYPEDRADLEVR